MNSFLKLAIASAIVGPALLASSAFAASFSNGTFVDNGNTSITRAPGASTNLSFEVTVGANETVQCIDQEIVGSPFPATHNIVGGSTGFQQSAVPQKVTLPVIAPQNTNTSGYTITETAHGNFNGANLGCNGPIVGGATYSNALFVLANGGSTTSTDTNTAPVGVSQSVWDKFVAWINSAGSTTPAPAPATGICAKLSGFSSLHVGSTGTRVKALQRLLNTQGAGLPVTGYYGTMTDGAVGDVGDENNCN